MEESIEKPAKRRLRRLAKWFGWLWVSVVVLGIVGHTAWYWYETRQLNLKIVEIESRGEPATVAALQPQLPPADENGWIDLVQAIDVISTKTPASKKENECELDPQYPLTPEERALLQTYCSERAAALAMIDAGYAKPTCVMTTPVEPFATTPYAPELNHIRGVANFLRYQALVDFDRGDHALALDRLERIELPARAAGSKPILIAKLVADGARGVQTSAYFELTPDLEIAPVPGGASVEQIRRAIASLLDANQLDAELRNAMLGERVLALEMMQALANGTPQQPPTAPTPAQADDSYALKVGRYLQTPWIRANMVQYTRLAPVYAEVWTVGDLPTMRQLIHRPGSPITAVRDSRFYLLASILVPSLDRFGETVFQQKTDRHLAACVLAIQLYRHDHQNQWPGSLNQLVPDYLPEVPKDLMTTGQPLHYRAGDSPILWSVGTNGIDDGGDDQSLKSGASEWARPDRVVHLTTQPRVPAE